MRVATWNLQCVRPGTGARSARIRDALASVAADVLVLTESHPEFVPATGYVRRAVSAEAPDRERGGRWVVIWTRAEISCEPLEVRGEPERTAGIRVERTGARPILIFGTVLPWRGDARRNHLRGGEAFAHSIALQAADWSEARAAAQSAELCVAGDFNQEFGAASPVGTRAGRAAFDHVLATHRLTCVTGGSCDPLLERGWRANIDHVLVSEGLRPVVATEVWPEQFPLPRTLSDHHGVCIRVPDA